MDPKLACSADTAVWEIPDANAIDKFMESIGLNSAELQTWSSFSRADVAHAVAAAVTRTSRSRTSRRRVARPAVARSADSDGEPPSAHSFGGAL